MTLNFGGSLKQSNLDTYGMVGEGFLKPSMNYISFAQQYLTGSSPSGGNVYKATVSTFGNLNFIWNIQAPWNRGKHRRGIVGP